MSPTHGASGVEVGGKIPHLQRIMLEVVESLVIMRNIKVMMMVVVVVVVMMMITTTTTRAQALPPAYWEHD